MDIGVRLLAMTDKILADDIKLLGTRQYWDIMSYQGHGFVPITRMQYSKEQCEEIIQLILSNQEKAEKYDIESALKCPICHFDFHGENLVETRDNLSQQNKKLEEEIKQLQGQMIGDEAYFQVLTKERDNLKEEINKLTFHAGCQGNPNCEWCKVRKKILGET